MKRIWFAVLLVFSLHAVASVLDSHTDIRIAKSGELTVTERITLEADGKTEERGLHLPVPEFAKVVDVIRNGHPEPYTHEGSGLRIGGEPLAPGRHRYQVTYRAAGQVRSQGGHDELRWKLQGAERITAEVILPASVPARQIKAEAVGRNYESFVRDGRAAFRSREGMTIVVRFPKGVLAEPGFSWKGLLLVLLGLGLAAWVLYRLKKGSEQLSRR